MPQNSSSCEATWQELFPSVEDPMQKWTFNWVTRAWRSRQRRELRWQPDIWCESGRMGCSGVPKGRGIAGNQTKLCLKPTQGQGFAEIPVIQKMPSLQLTYQKFLHLSSKLVELSKLSVCLSTCWCTCSSPDVPPEVLTQSVSSERWDSFGQAQSIDPSAAQRSGQSCCRLEVFLTKGTYLFVTTKTTTPTRMSEMTESWEMGSDSSKIFTLYVREDRKC